MSQITEKAAAANWITLRDWRRVALPTHAPYIAFRRDITIPAGRGKVDFFITASAGYTLWVDGKLVGSGPARSWPGRWLVDRLEASRFLPAGKRRIAVLLHPPTGGPAYGLSLPLGLCAWITMGNRTVLGTDEAWLAREADWIQHNNLVTALPVGWQEHHTAPGRWTLAAPGKDWRPAKILGPLGQTPPWGRAEVHDLPTAVEKEMDLRTVWSGRIGYNGQPSGNLIAPFLDATAYVMKGREQDAAFWLECGGRNTITLDTGRTRNMRPGFRVLACQGKVSLDCFLDISFNGRPTAGTGFGTHHEGSCDSIRVDQPQVWWRTQPRGGRFITWSARGRGRVLVQPLCRSVEYPYPAKATFNCDDPFYQRLWDVAGETIRASTTDVLVDTCFRENALWTFDACATGMGTFYRFGDPAMPGHCFRLVAEGVQEDGTVAGIVPSQGEGMACMLPDQTLNWVHTCLRYHDLTGDDVWARFVLPGMRKVMGFVARNCHEGLFVPPAWTWHWVDWAAIDKRPYSAVVNLLALRAGEATGILAQRLGAKETVKEMKSIRHSLRMACQRFYDNRKDAWVSHLEPSRGVRARIERSNHDTPHEVAQPVILHVNALALELGLGNREVQSRTVQRCVDLLRQPLGPANACGPGWIGSLLTPCCGSMDPGVIHRHLQRTYGQCFLDSGAPTFGEGFSANPFNTAHGWGASVIALMVEGLLGLRPGSPGWRTVRFAPRWPGQGDVAYTLETANGRISVRRSNGKWTMRTARGVVTR